MNRTEYKGFSILHLDNGRYAAQDKGDAKFNPDGYATLNNAKGAITKHLQAAGKEPVAGSVPAPKAATSDDSARASVPAQAVSEWTTQRNTKGDPIHADPATAYLYAQLDYYGIREGDTRSRAKREGVNPNRKHKSRASIRRAVRAYKSANPVIYGKGA